MEAAPRIIRVKATFLCPGGTNASIPQDPLEFTHEGIRGDRHHGFMKLSGGREKRLYEEKTLISNLRQWSAVSQEELNQIAAGMGLPYVRPEWLGANLLVEGCSDFTQLPPLTRLVFERSGLTLLVYKENMPCDGPMKVMREQASEVVSEEAAKRFGKASIHKRGLVGLVECQGSGIIRPGNTAIIVPFDVKIG